jgi:phosphate transport system protein
MTAHFVNLLNELRRRSLRMASQVEDMLEEAGEIIFQQDPGLARRVVDRDSEIDEEEVGIETEIIRLLALYQPVGRDLRLLATILKVNSDLERVADCVVNIAERARHLEVQALAARNEDLRQLFPLVRRALREAIAAYAAEDQRAARQVLHEDAAIDALYGQIVRQVVASAAEVSTQMAGVLDLLSIAKNLERIADHATNIAEDVVFLVTGSIVRHHWASGPGLPPEAPAGPELSA